MRAMILEETGPFTAGSTPLISADWPKPTPAAGAISIRVSVCGVCHTEMDEIEGRVTPPRFPVIPGHQVVGRVESLGEGAVSLRVGDRVGVAWIYSACGRCRFCTRNEENLCDRYRATGRDADGGSAEFMTVPEAFAHPIPDTLTDAEAAPLLCAGAIGYRSLRVTGLENGQPLGLTGFGASAHLVLKLARHRFPASEIFVFARSAEERAFARELGATWVGEAREKSPSLLDAIIDTTPARTPVVRALENLERGGRLIINAIRKDDADKDALVGLDYPKHLWLEKRSRASPTSPGPTSASSSAWHPRSP